MSGIAAFIARLDSAGLLERCAERVDWNLEIGQRLRAQRRRRPPRALLFENIRDYPGDRVLCGACAGVPHQALALGLPFGTGRGGLVARVRQAARTPIAPLLTAAPTAVTGRSSLQQLPVPWWHPRDAGRYVGTWHVNVTHHPRTADRNVGTYRMQILDDRHATVSVSPASHLAQHFAAAEALNRDLPMAVAIGVEEAVVMAGAAALPLGFDEYGFAGALMDRPLMLRACETIDCSVPADAQYVLEGHILRGRRVCDGPFFDYAGVTSTNPRALLFRVDRIAATDGPVFRGTSVGAPGAEDHAVYVCLARAGLMDFHGNRLRGRLQRWLAAAGCFRALQWTGRGRRLLRRGS